MYELNFNSRPFGRKTNQPLFLFEHCVIFSKDQALAIDFFF